MPRTSFPFLDYIISYLEAFARIKSSFFNLLVLQYLLLVIDFYLLLMTVFLFIIRIKKRTF